MKYKIKFEAVFNVSDNTTINEDGFSNIVENTIVDRINDLLDEDELSFTSAKCYTQEI